MEDPLWDVPLLTSKKNRQLEFLSLDFTAIRLYTYITVIFCKIASQRKQVYMHRYGRYGPKAWLRWRKHHYTHQTKLPVPVVKSPAAVLVHYVERIIIIVGTPPEDITDIEAYRRDVPRITEEVPTPQNYSDLTRKTEYIARRIIEKHPHTFQAFACMQATTERIIYRCNFDLTYELGEAEIRVIEDTYNRYLKQRNIVCSSGPEEDDLIRAALHDAKTYSSLEPCQIYALAGLHIGRLWRHTLPDIPTALVYVDRYVQYFLHPEQEVLWELPQGVFL